MGMVQEWSDTVESTHCSKKCSNFGDSKLSKWRGEEGEGRMKER